MPGRTEDQEENTLKKIINSGKDVLGWIALEQKIN